MFTKSSAILASAVMVFVAPAFAQSTTAVLKRTLPVGTQTNLGVQTFPNARCVLHFFGESSSAPGIKLFANDRGIIHFSFQADVAGTQQFELDCTGDNGTSSVVPISLSSESGASDINNDSAVTLPDVGTVQEPLGPDPMSITPEQLRAAGYPRRPDQYKTPHLFASWAKMVTSRNTRVVFKPITRPDAPEFQYVQPSPPTPEAGFGTGPSLNGFKFIESIGEWVLPHTLGYPYAYPYQGNSRLAGWVGVQSLTDTQNILYQSGVAQDNTCVHSLPGYCWATVYNTWAWYESPPNDPSHPLTGFTVNEHDHIYVDVAVMNDLWQYNCLGPNMYFYIYNFRTNTYVQGLIPQKADHVMVCVGATQHSQFVVENQNRRGFTFPQWTDNFFMSGSARDDQNRSVLITETGTTIGMLPTTYVQMVSASSNNVMAYFAEDNYTHADVLFQWFAWQ